MRQAELTAEIEALAEQSYDQLDGDWADWLDTAKRYEHRAMRQDRLDVRHTILLELARAKARDGDKPIPKLRQYRIASLTVAMYWRQQGKGQSRVCVFDGVAKTLHCEDCHHKPKEGKCPWLAVRPPISLDSEVEDSDGDMVSLKEVIADDTAIDLGAWVDAKLWRLTCPIRLALIAQKIVNGERLTGSERKYLCKMRKRYEQKSLIGGVTF